MRQHRIRRNVAASQRDVLLAAAAVAFLFVSSGLDAQGRGGQTPPAPPPTPKASAPIDLTGYWVSVVSEDWRWRMVTPAKGDYASVPITLEAKKIADAWDPAKDEAAGEQCRSYGAPIIMRVPGRMHITWADDNTLSIETDAGMQRRLFHFGTAIGPRGVPTWQGESRAQWERPRATGGRAPAGAALNPAGAGSAVPMTGSLKVLTTQLRPGYLRKNGIPYSANTVLTEYWDRFKERNGDEWITITTVVEDPQYLREPWVTALHFKKERDGAKWDPTPCSARW